jgi:hypothetical protein
MEQEPRENSASETMAYGLIEHADRLGRAPEMF